MKFWLARKNLYILEGGEHTRTQYEWDHDGGMTYGGFTQSTFDAYLKRYDLPKRKVSTITPPEATGLMFHEYWITSGGMMPDLLDFMLFQFAFVAYWVVANKEFQLSFNDQASSGVLLKIDGMIGPNTLEAVHNLSRLQKLCVLDDFTARQKDFFSNLGKKDPTRPVKGWHNRVDRAYDMVRAYAKE